MPQYNVGEILKEDIIIISHRIIEREVKPFTNPLARILFEQFWDESFFLDGKIGHILVTDGKMVMPPEGHGYADCAIFKETIEEADAMSNPQYPIARVTFDICFRGPSCYCPFPGKNMITVQKF